MKYTKDEDGEFISIESRSMDNFFEVGIGNADGFGGTDVYIEAGHMTWEQLDQLKLAIAYAEQRWRRR